MIEKWLVFVVTGTHGMDYDFPETLGNVILSQLFPPFVVRLLDTRFKNGMGIDLEAPESRGMSIKNAIFLVC